MTKHIKSPIVKSGKITNVKDVFFDDIGRIVEYNAMDKAPITEVAIAPNLSTKQHLLRATFATLADNSSKIEIDAPATDDIAVNITSVDGSLIVAKTDGVDGGAVYNLSVVDATPAVTVAISTAAAAGANLGEYAAKYNVVDANVKADSIVVVNGMTTIQAPYATFCVANVVNGSFTVVGTLLSPGEVYSVKYKIVK